MNSATPPPATEVAEMVRRALAEDVGPGDVTAGLIGAETRARAHIVCRQAAVICGIAWAAETLSQVDDRIRVDWQVNDGGRVENGAVIAVLNGPARGILTAERTVLNFLQTLSATATRTRVYVNAVLDYRVKLLDTRKTLPGLRRAQKYAVRCGGGHNHRMGLYDAFLIKENHIRAAGGVAEAIRLARRQQSDIMVEVEIERLEQLQTAIDAGTDRILLDNFNDADLRAAVAETAGRVPLEASGSITLDNIARVAATGVDYISLGALTKDVEAVDLSLLFV